MNSRNKNLYRALLLLAFVGINAAILFGIGAVWVYMNSGADKASILHLTTGAGDNYQPKIVWEELENEGRPMEQQTLLDIQKDYLRSWYVRNVAFASNDPYGLDDYFTDSMRVKLKRVLELNRTNGTTVKQTTLTHHPRLEFYSSDGKLVVFTDQDVEAYNEVWQGEEKLHTARQINSYRVLMLLEDGFWRIRHFEEIETPEESVSTQNFVSQANFKDLKGLNYYPAKTPWDLFGVDFDGDTIKSDFQKINQMGLNTVRIFIPYQDFGEADVKEEKLDKLKTVFDLAEESDLKLLVTLFDFYGDYDLMDWNRTHRHAETIVSSVREHPALLGWDIKNEPDLDFESRGKAEVLAWLEEMIRQIKKFDPDHPVTIGWSSASAAVHLTEELDFISYHFYESPEMFAPSLSEVRSQINNKPVMISEFGISSYSGIWNVFTSSEEDQANYYSKMVSHFEKENVSFLSWTLYDFENIPVEVVGRLPWRRAPQRNYGLIGRDGRTKRAYEFMKMISKK
ncbi:cellulase family glycosylhydrolase [Muriicola sp. SD30]|uniref:cellulase family glycosylhydrolase n=1 Tax=Muriicola sp. SD30 TaxID=3240936 RepID=UPI00350F0B79